MCCGEFENRRAGRCWAAGNYFPPVVLAMHGESVTVQNSVFDGNVCHWNATQGCHSGAIYVTEGTFLSLINTIVTNNRGQ
jgi:hypothetical protein